MTRPSSYRGFSRSSVSSIGQYVSITFGSRTDSRRRAGKEKRGENGGKTGCSLSGPLERQNINLTRKSSPNLRSRHDLSHTIEHSRMVGLLQTWSSHGVTVCVQTRPTVSHSHHQDHAIELAQVIRKNPTAPELPKLKLQKNVRSR